MSMPPVSVGVLPIFLMKISVAPLVSFATRFLPSCRTLPSYHREKKRACSSHYLFHSPHPLPDRIYRNGLIIKSESQFNLQQRPASECKAFPEVELNVVTSSLNPHDTMRTSRSNIRGYVDGHTHLSARSLVAVLLSQVILFIAGV